MTKVTKRQQKWQKDDKLKWQKWQKDDKKSDKKTTNEEKAITRWERASLALP